MQYFTFLCLSTGRLCIYFVIEISRHLESDKKKRGVHAKKLSLPTKPLKRQKEFYIANMTLQIFAQKTMRISLVAIQESLTNYKQKQGLQKVLDNAVILPYPVFHRVDAQLPVFFKEGLPDFLYPILPQQTQNSLYLKTELQRLRFFYIQQYSLFLC